MKVGPFQFSLPVPFASLKPVGFVCPLEQLLVLEVFAGVASLSHECRAAGFTVMSVDQQQHRFCKAKPLKLDLTKPKDQCILLHACVFANVAYAHFAPPRATSSGAPPLRSEQRRMGFPWLQGQDRQRVHSANVLYALTLIAALLVHRRAVVSVEGPSSSYTWFVLGLFSANTQFCNSLGIVCNRMFLRPACAVAFLMSSQIGEEPRAFSKTAKTM